MIRYDSIGKPVKNSRFPTNISEYIIDMSSTSSTDTYSYMRIAMVYLQ